MQASVINDELVCAAVIWKVDSWKKNPELISAGMDVGVPTRRNSSPARGECWKEHSPRAMSERDEVHLQLVMIVTRTHFGEERQWQR